MNEKKQKMIKNMLNISAIIWGIYAILISLICLIPQFFFTICSWKQSIR